MSGAGIVQMERGAVAADIDVVVVVVVPGRSFRVVCWSVARN